MSTNFIKKVKKVRKDIKKIEEKMFHLKIKFKNLPLFSSFKSLLLTIITIILLGFALSKIDLGLFLEAIKKLNIKYFFILFVLSAFEIYLYSKRFVMLLDIKYSLEKFFGYLVGMVFGRVVPPRPFGEYLRLLLTMHYFKTSLKTSIFAIVIDNLYDTIVFLFFGIGATIILANNVLFWKIVAYLLIIFAIIFIFYMFYSNFLFLKDTFGLKLFYKLLNYIKKLIYDYVQKFFEIKKSILFFGIFLTIVNYLVSFFKAYIVLRMLNVNIDFISVAAIWSLANLIGQASMLPGGFGAFELSFMYLLQDFGVSDTIGLTAALIERIFNIWLFAGIGFWYFLVSKTPLQKIQNKFLGFVDEEVRNIYFKVDYKIKSSISDVKNKVKTIVKGE